MSTPLNNTRLQAVETDLIRVSARLGQLETGSSDIRETVVKLKDSAQLPALKSGWRTPQVIVSILSVVVSIATLGYNFIKADRLSSSINGKGGIREALDAQKEKQGKLETGLRMIAVAAAPQFLHELDESLESSAQLTGDQKTSRISGSLSRFSAQISNLASLRIPVDQAFFSNSAMTLNKLDSTLKLGEQRYTDGARLSLADYRSAVFHPQDLTRIFAPGSNVPVTVDELASLPRHGDYYYKGLSVTGSVGGKEVLRGVTTQGSGGSILMNQGAGDLVIPGPGGIPGAAHEEHAYSYTEPGT